MSKYIYGIIVLLMTLILSGCQSQGEPIAFATQENKNAVNVKVLKANYYKKNTDYVNKEVVVNGLYFHTCTTEGCNEDFVLRDGGEQVTVITMGKYNIQDLRAAQPLRVTGILKETKQSPFIHALKIEKIEDTGEI